MNTQQNTSNFAENHLHMILKIFHDIVDEEDKLLLQWDGLDGVTYNDVREALAAMPEDDSVIDIRLHCDGGNVVEGWSIYDALRQAAGKTISATIEGKCSSIATIILLAAPKERRFAYRNASLCIHNPALAQYPDDLFCCSRLTSGELRNQSDMLKSLATQLDNETAKILNLYVERTGADLNELKKLMEQDIYINMDKALELGFIGSILPEMTDTKSHKSTNLKSNKSMDKISIDAKTAARICALYGVKTPDELKDLKVLDQYITSASGESFTVEREEGDPQVGDVAYPDGTYTMEDGTVVVVADGVITEINKPAEEGTEGDGGGEGGTPTEEDQLKAQIDDLQAQLDELKGKVNDKDTQIADMQAKLDEANKQIEALKGTQKTEDEADILETVGKAGGKEWLDKVCGMKSTFSPKNRQFVAHKDRASEGAPENETKTQRKIRETKEAYAKRRNKEQVTGKKD